MAVPVLATKLYIPPPPPKIVARTRLIERMNQGLSASRKLTLISAPAGFGKSTLASEWIAQSGRPAGWLSLDADDSDPTRFLVYLISALQAIDPDLGAEILDVLQSSQLPVESVLTAVLNKAASLPEDFILVLDDYHVVDSRAIDQALTFLVEHLPARMHLVITTREDPALPLPRLRARNQLTELRAADLRFTPDEAAEFLRQVMGLDLSAEQVTALEDRTEGWIAGLQLAALSMSSNRDAAGFIQAFAGDHRYIVDYLVEEVLQRQPEEIRNFLLQTSILDRLNAPLCEAVTSQTGSKARLETLHRSNLFLIPLDDKRNWYRYHHLFAEVLQMHLAAEQPDQVPALHRRASEWYEQHGFAADAIQHALAGRDFDRAAGLIERAVTAMGQGRQESTLLGWFQALPEEVFRSRPLLNVHYAGTLLQTGHAEGVEARLREAERWLNLPPGQLEQPIFADEEDFHRLPGLIAMYHAGFSLASGDVDNTMKYAREVLSRAREDDNFQRGAASSLIGLAAWTSGDLETAYLMFAKGMAHLHQAGFIPDVIGGSVTLADILITQGHLREAMSTYERSLQLATRPGASPLRGAADMHVGMSALYRERNDLHTAMQHILHAKELGEFNGLLKNPYRWRVALARILQAQGDLNGALDLLDEAGGVFMSDFSPDVHPFPAVKARLWIAQGKLDEALAWAHVQGLTFEDKLNYLLEFEHITLARLLLARGASGQAGVPVKVAVVLLERLLSAAEEGGRMGSVIEIRALQALAYQMQGDVSGALRSLEPALELAEPEGYARIFLDEGRPMEALLRQAARQGILPEYTGRLLAGFKAEGQENPAASVPSASTSLIEPLSQREREILRLFKTELSGPEIARELVVALSTVRTHTKSIYSKLGVSSRRAAVIRAEELGLI